MGFFGFLERVVGDYWVCGMGAVCDCGGDSMTFWGSLDFGDAIRLLRRRVGLAI